MLLVDHSKALIVVFFSLWKLPLFLRCSCFDCERQSAWCTLRWMAVKQTANNLKTRTTTKKQKDIPGAGADTCQSYGLELWTSSTDSILREGKWNSPDSAQDTSSCLLYLLKNRRNNAGTLHLGQVSPFLSNHRLKGFSEVKAGNFVFHRVSKERRKYLQVIVKGNHWRQNLLQQTTPTLHRRGGGFPQSCLVVYVLPFTQRGEPWGAPLTKREGTFLSHLRHRGNGSILRVYGTK